MMSLPLDRDAIAARIPHHGGMCLLERATEATPERIVCTAVSHRVAGNPLRMGGRLSAVHAIEYAAQAMALHRSFADGAAERAPRGMLTSARDVVCHVEWLDDIPGELTVVATRLAGDGVTVLYGFAVRDDARELVTGRASAVLDVGRVDSR